MSLVHETVRAASEALTLEDLNAAAVPLLEQALGAHLTAVVQFNQDGRPEFKAGNLGRCAPQLYFEHYFREDPVTLANRRLNRKICVDERDLDRRKFEASEAYDEYYRSRDIGRVLCFRMITSRYYQPGCVMMGFFRARSQPSFTGRELRLLVRVLPALEAAAKRSQRLEQRLRAAAATASLLNLQQARRFALDRTGHLLWASSQAAAILPRPLPPELLDAAHRLVALAAGEQTQPVFSVNGIELHVERWESGEPFVVGEIQPDFAREFALTPTEMTVLDQLSQGRSNQQIQKQLHVSLSTVKTHVHRLLQKLGVSSRLQAVLLRQQRR